MPRKSKTPSTTLQHVHETHESVSSIELTPAHDPREDTPIYRASHQRLIYDEDRPCFVCGVRHSDLQDPVRAKDPKINPKQAVQMESHHAPIERSLASAIDRDALARDYPSVLQFKTLMEWIDSENNLYVLCDKDHRGEGGIHHVMMQDFLASKYAIRGADGTPYQFAATATDAAAVEAKDEQIEQQAGMEPAA